MASYLSPDTVEEGLSALASGRFRLVAGGTDVYPALRDRPLQDDMIDLHRIASLRGIAACAQPAAGWRIGALATWTDLLKQDLPPLFDGLKAAAREVGSVQIQNAATIVGNICNASPAADGVPPLLALDAEVEIAALSGSRRLPLGDFILGPRRTALAADEMVTGLFLPDPGAAARSAFGKLGARRYLVISIAMVAVTLVPDAGGRIGEARVAVGSCSPVARRLPALEAALRGQPARASELAAMVEATHLAPLDPIGDVRGTADYRRHAALELVRRALAECATLLEMPA
ncbi:FAD binding domain-containing protein [Marinibaculum pumilum]|uniref:FAD binding domain-containing protein n=1 Tax=Marinibaculum pumilum TaxID=1766165 RepID=A0ABV7L4S0_9PROT